jgi:serine/threonine-protein kinase RsbW
MNVRLSLDLPRETESVPLARRIVAATLGTVGVSDDCRADILLAVAEACANAVTHAQPAANYQVRVDIDDARCLIEVVDAGRGVPASQRTAPGHGVDPGLTDRPGEPPMPQEPATLDESGRGLHIIEAVSDQFDLRRNSPSGTLVRFAKRLDRPT